jgi:hypothetical protein
MSTINIPEAHRILTERIKEYIAIIINEFGSYMPEEVLNKLTSINDYSQILKIYDYGEVSAYADLENVHMPLCADRLLNMASKVPGYGINKEHKTYNSENMVINNNTFLTYIKHIFISGTDALGYYEDLLLHEVMHFCGSGGGTVLDEGINELLTRMTAQKYNLRTNSCGYPKEVSLAYELMKCFGEETIKRLAFINDFNQKIEYLRNNLGEEAANMYLQVTEEAELEFNEKYYSHMSEFSGALGIAKKILFYKKIDYSNIYNIIHSYNSDLSDERSNKHM